MSPRACTSTASKQKGYPVKEDGAVEVIINMFQANEQVTMTCLLFSWVVTKGLPRIPPPAIKSQVPRIDQRKLRSFTNDLGGWGSMRV